MDKTTTYYPFFLILLIFVLLPLNSCTNSNDEKAVYMAEELIGSNPDSAFILLNSIDFPEDLSESTYARYCRLLVLAHQKNKVSIKEDSIIHDAVYYYKNRKGKRDEYIQSLLLSGNVYEAQDSVSQAEEQYLETFSLGWQENNPELYGVSAYELGGLYKCMGNYDKSIVWFNIAARVFTTNNMRISRLRILLQTADCYALSGDSGNALAIYKEVLTMVPRRKPEIKADIYKNMALTYKKAKEYDKGLQSIRKSIEVAPRKSLYPVQYMVLASIYEDMGNLDSMAYYMKVALRYAREQNNSSVVLKAQEARFDANNPRSFDNYMLSKSLSDWNYYRKQKDETVIYQRINNIEKIRKKNKELTFKQQRSMFLIVFISFACATLFLSQYNNRKKRQAQFEQELEDKNSIINAIRNSLYQRLAIYKKMVQLSISPNKEKHRPFLREYNKVLFRKNTDFSLDWDIISSLVNHIFDNYIEKLDALFPALTATERKIIILRKAGFSVVEVAAILGKSIHTMYKYTSNIRKNLEIPETDTILDFIEEKFQAKH